MSELREGWLQEAASFLTHYLANFHIQCPLIRVSCGFPSKNGLRAQKRVIGECFEGQACTDGRPQIFISPTLADSVKVLATLLHEMLHAAIGCEHGHKKPFSQAARKAGLDGKPTATVVTVGSPLHTILVNYVRQSGAYPHAAIRSGRSSNSGSDPDDADATRPGSRLRLYECACEPTIKIRVARDDFQGLCLICNKEFQRVETK